MSACGDYRYAQQTLETGGAADASLESADTVYVYDYCYLMRQAADSNAQRHWLLKDTYNGTRGKGAELLKLYRCAASPERCRLRQRMVSVLLKCRRGCSASQQCPLFFGHLPVDVTHAQLRGASRSSGLLWCCIESMSLYVCNIDNSKQSVAEAARRVHR